MSTVTVKQRVTYILQKFKTARDNDMFLLAKFWEQESGSKTLSTSYLTNGLLTSPETIRRTRQRVQQERRNLRGTTYRDRQVHTA